MPELTVENQIYTLHLGDDENRFTPDWIAGVSNAVAEVTNADGPRALVTVASGKFWSNGLDLDWLGANPDELEHYVGTVHALYAQFLSVPFPTIAVLQGHTFAAGAMMSLAHDVRIMRDDRGYFCLPEVNINIPFTAGMSALITSRLSPSVAHEAMTTGRRYGGREAHDAGIVDTAVSEELLLDTAHRKAAELAPTAGSTLAAIRTEMYKHVIAELTGTPTR